MMFDGDPDFVNEEGTKWWLYKSLTKRLHRAGLDWAFVYEVEQKDGYRTRVILDQVNDTIIYENGNIEQLGAHIDMMILASQKLQP